MLSSAPLDAEHHWSGEASTKTLTSATPSAGRMRWWRWLSKVLARVTEPATSVHDGHLVQLHRGVTSQPRTRYTGTRERRHKNKGRSRSLHPFTSPFTQDPDAGRGTRRAGRDARTHASTRPHEGTRKNASTPSSSVTVSHGTPATLRAHASRSPAGPRAPAVNEKPFLGTNTPTVPPGGSPRSGEHAPRRPNSYTSTSALPCHAHASHMLAVQPRGTV